MEENEEKYLDDITGVVGQILDEDNELAPEAYEALEQAYEMAESGEAYPQDIIDNINNALKYSMSYESRNSLKDLCKGELVTEEKEIKTEDYNYDDGFLHYLFNVFEINKDGEIVYTPEFEDAEIYKDLDMQEYENSIARVTDLINNANFYSDGGEIYIQLNDNRTMWEIDNENIDEEIYNSALQPYIEAFEEDTNVKLYLLGRSGRHVCVEYNLENLENYNELKAEQEKQEKAFIEEMNSYGKEEESKEVVTEGKSIKDVINNIENAKDGDEIQEAINSISNESLAQAAQIQFDATTESGEDLETVKHMVLNVLSDADQKEEAKKVEEESKEVVTEEDEELFGSIKNSEIMEDILNASRYLLKYAEVVKADPEGYALEDYKTLKSIADEFQNVSTKLYKYWTEQE